MMLYNLTSEFLYLNSWRSFYKASSRDGLALDSEFCGVPRIFSELFGQSKGSQISLAEREHTRVYCNFCGMFSPTLHTYKALLFFGLCPSLGENGPVSQGSPGQMESARSRTNFSLATIKIFVTEFPQRNDDWEVILRGIKPEYLGLHINI